MKTLVNAGIYIATHDAARLAFSLAILIGLAIIGKFVSGPELATATY